MKIKIGIAEALRLIKEADDLLFPLENENEISDDIRTNLIEVIDMLEDILDEEVIKSEWSTNEI